MQNKLNFVFFGGEPLGVPTLEKLYQNNLIPILIVSNPDRPKGRNLEITPPPTAIWAKDNDIPLLQPEKLKDLKINFEIDLIIVVSYGKIIPKEILDSAKFGTINIHPSLLPHYRGPSPIISAILNGDNATGVTIIKIDEEMDHGPILAQEKINLSGNEFVEELEERLAQLGGELLVKTIFKLPETKGIDQDHTKATFLKKIEKSDAEIKLDDDAIKNWRKFRAYHNGPRIFFFKDTKRIIITKARLENDKFVIEKVIPENGKEMDWKSN